MISQALIPLFLRAQPLRELVSHKFGCFTASILAAVASVSAWTQWSLGGDMWGSWKKGQRHLRTKVAGQRGTQGRKGSEALLSAGRVLWDKHLNPQLYRSYLARRMLRFGMQSGTAAVKEHVTIFTLSRVQKTFGMWWAADASISHPTSDVGGGVYQKKYQKKYQKNYCILQTGTDISTGNLLHKLLRVNNRWHITGAAFILSPHVLFLISNYTVRLLWKLLCLVFFSAPLGASKVVSPSSVWEGIEIFISEEASFICAPRDDGFGGNTVQCERGARSPVSWESASRSSFPMHSCTAANDVICHSGNTLSNRPQPSPERFFLKND